MIKNEFKIGDRVRIKDHPLVNPDYVGRICEVASVNEGAYITFKDCDSCWNPEVLELIEPLDRKTAFLTELRELMHKYDAKIESCAEGTEDSWIDIYFGDECVICFDRNQQTCCATITADNIMDFDKK